jgi:hypothetical protein
MYAQVDGKKVINYPCHPLFENPNTSFVENWVEGPVNGKTYVLVEDTDPPIPKLGYYVERETPVYNETTKKFKEVWVSKKYELFMIKQLITERRYYVETSGIKVDDNYFQTDRESQTKYAMGALFKEKLLWKTKMGKFVEIDAEYINNKVKTHVRACFETECKYLEILNSGDDNFINNTDFDLDWPSND